MSLTIRHSVHDLLARAKDRRVSMPWPHFPHAHLRLLRERGLALYRLVHPLPLLRDAHLTVTLDMVLTHYRRDHPGIFVLQVGAFDGISGDAVFPLIEKHDLRGVVLEPQHDAFRRLQENYARFDPSQFVTVNAAIAERDGMMQLYRIKAGVRGPGWLPQTASFDKSVLMTHAARIPHLEALVETEEVTCLTFDTLFKKLAIDHVDLLQIDAEGYDAKLVWMFNVPVRQPAIVRFEHRHLSERDYSKCISMLIAQGYKISADKNDTLAYRESP